jgi:ABC-2 type transport system ATP-binding protein
MLGQAGEEMPRWRQGASVRRGQDPQEEQVAVRAHGLRKSYGSLVALHGVSLQASRGRVFAYPERNDVAKTTTINISCRLIAREDREVSSLGEDVAHGPGLVKSRIGVVTENFNLCPELRCRRNLEYDGGLCGLPGAERRKYAEEELLGGFSLSEKAEAPFGSLSRGMKRLF